MALAWLGTVASGCNPDCPWGSTYCDGDLLMHCNTRCGGTARNPRQCDTQISSLDCAKDFPVRKTCHAFRADGRSSAMCLDAPLTACTPSPQGGIRSQPIACAPSGRLQSCQTLGSEAFLDSSDCEQPQLVCHATSTGLACVNAPKAPCDPGEYPRCEGGHQQLCVGGEDAGYAQRTRECAPGSACVVRDGGRTDCEVDAGAPDGG